MMICDFCCNTKFFFVHGFEQLCISCEMNKFFFSENKMIKVTFACILIEFLTVLCLQSNNSSERAMNTNTQDMKLPFVQLSLNQTAPDAGKPNVTNLYDRDGISAKQNPPKTNPLFLSIMDTIFKRYNVRLVSKKPNEANVYIKKPGNK